MILSLILQNADKNPDKPAIISCKSEIITYADLKQGIYNYAKYFNDENLCAGDNVILSADKEIEFIYAYFALHLLRICAVIVDPESNNQRVKYITSLVKPKKIIGLPNCTNTEKYIKHTNNIVDNNWIDEKISLIQNNDICDILFTTGTTGNPKGVKLSQGNISSSTNNINTFIQNNNNDRELLALPLCHSFGLGRMRCTLSIGATLILINNFANIKLLFSTLKEYQITGLGFVPSIWYYIKKFSGLKIKEFATNLRYIEIGSAPMLESDKKLLCSLFPNTRICMHYGLTEASRSTFIEFHEDYNKLDSIGYPIENTSIKILNENGNEVSNGEEGEICISGPHVFQSYFIDEENNNSFWGNFFRTGDWGKKDNEGYIYLVGRKKEMINIGGKKISPIEIESCINELPQIKDNICVGIKDPNGILGEVIKSYVCLKENNFIDPKEIKEHVRRNLESYKIPSSIEFVEKLPITKSGKKQRLLI